MTRGFIDGEYQDGELRGLSLALGKRGYGKTTLVGNLLNQCTGGVILFDPTAKHASLLPGCVVFYEAEKCVPYLRVNRGRRFRIVVQPRRGDIDGHFRKLCSIVDVFGWMIFAIDEIDRVCGARYGDSRMPPELSHLVNYGRHSRVSMIATARRPTTVPAAYREEAEMRIFALKKATAEQLIGDIDKETVEQIVKLQKYYYLRCAPDAEPILCGGPR